MIRGLKSGILALAFGLIAGAASAQTWIYAGRSPDWAIAVDADSVERSGSTVTIRQLYVAKPGADGPRPGHDYLTAKVVVDCEQRTLFKHSYEYFAFGQSGPTARSRERTASIAIRDHQDQRLWRAACTDFLRGGARVRTEDWVTILVQQLYAPDAWREPQEVQDWAVSRRNNYSCEIRSGYDDSTVLAVTLEIDGTEKLSLRAPEYEGLPAAQTQGAVAVRREGDEWTEVFRGPVNFSSGLRTEVRMAVPGLLDALENAVDFGLIAEGLPPQGLQVGPMNEAVASLRACSLGSADQGP